jgi:hypothetical protein
MEEVEVELEVEVEVEESREFASIGLVPFTLLGVSCATQYPKPLTFFSKRC